jgi:hypothetical protein
MASYPAWVRFRWNEAFLWKRVALSFTLAALPAIACFSQGWGIAGLLMMAIGAWPVPPRVSVDSRGLLCRWLVVEERVALSHITHARVEPDARRLALFRPTVLSLGRHAKQDLRIVAPRSILQRLERDLRSEAALAGAPLSSDGKPTRRAAR